MRLGHAALMVAQDCNHAVGLVVGQVLVVDRSTVGDLEHLPLHGIRGVVGTENLCREPLHIALQMLVEVGGLGGG